MEIVLVLVVVLDLADLDYDYEGDDEDDALRVCRRLTGQLWVAEVGYGGQRLGTVGQNQNCWYICKHLWPGLLCAIWVVGW